MAEPTEVVCRLYERLNFLWPREWQRNGKKSPITMHRQILNVPKGVEVDHANLDGLDNRRSNLRIATRSQNNANRRGHHDNLSGVKGVSRHKETGKWMVQIAINNRDIYLGLFSRIKDAAAAYAQAANHYFGEFARVTPNNKQPALQTETRAANTDNRNEESHKIPSRQVNG